MQTQMQSLFCANQKQGLWPCSAFSNYQAGWMHDWLNDQLTDWLTEQQICWLFACLSTSNSLCERLCGVQYFLGSAVEWCRMHALVVLCLCSIPSKGLNLHQGPSAGQVKTASLLSTIRQLGHIVSQFNQFQCNCTHFGIRSVSMHQSGVQVGYEISA